MNQGGRQLDIFIALPESEQVTEESLHLACSALFIEMMYMDDKADIKEQDMILTSVKALFSKTIILQDI